LARDVGLPVAGVRFLLRLADQEPPQAAGTVLDEELGQNAVPLIDLGLLVPGPAMNSVAVGSDLDLRPILEIDRQAKVATCFHPECGFVTVPTDHLRTWKVDTAKLVRFLCHLLGLPASFKPAPLVDGLLWDLGTPRLGKRTGTGVLFARGLSRDEDRRAVRAELDLRRGGKETLLLTTSRYLSDDLHLPAVSRIVPIEDVMSRTAAIAGIDISRLAALVRAPSDSLHRHEGPVQCGKDGTWLRLHGKDHMFRGTQAAIIRLLYEAWETGEDWVGEQEVLENERVESGSKKIKEAFSGKDGWRDVVEVKQGQCRLKVRDEA
jgi:hypothetical protein